MHGCTLHSTRRGFLYCDSPEATWQHSQRKPSPSTGQTHDNIVLVGSPQAVLQLATVVTEAQRAASCFSESKTRCAGENDLSYASCPSCVKMKESTLRRTINTYIAQVNDQVLIIN